MGLRGVAASIHTLSKSHIFFYCFLNFRFNNHSIQWKNKGFWSQKLNCLIQLLFWSVCTRYLSCWQRWKENIWRAKRSFCSQLAPFLSYFFPTIVTFVSKTQIHWRRKKDFWSQKLDCLIWLLFCLVCMLTDMEKKIFGEQNWVFCSQLAPFPFFPISSPPFVSKPNFLSSVLYFVVEKPSRFKLYMHKTVYQDKDILKEPPSLTLPLLPLHYSF